MTYVSARTLARRAGVQIPNLYYHWRKLRQMEQLLGVADPLPAKGLLTGEQAQRLADFITEKRRAKNKVKQKLSNSPLDLHRDL